MQPLWADIRYAIRDLLSARAFAIVAIATLALGIGAPTAMFTVINAVLLRPLPFRSPEQLLAVKEFDPRRGPDEGGSFSYPDFADLRTRSRSFTELAAYQDSEFMLTGAGEAQHVHAEVVSSEIFKLLGAAPQIGRLFLPDEDRPGHHMVVLSDAYWHRHFHADPAVQGKRLALNGREYTIVGVAPPGFSFPSWPINETSGLPSHKPRKSTPRVTLPLRKNGVPTS